ncbi:MAG: aminotransferase class IV [Chromatiales bacterium]|nr:aminotransferase class IV [Chromatiales bacterium]
MSTAYLNGEYLPLSEARVSPLDRGFLFGDGIYEVIPSYNGRMVGFTPHIERMQRGLATVGINLDWSVEQWRELCTSLMKMNDMGNLGLYLHVTRGQDTTRFHAYPEGVSPTVFAFVIDIPPEQTVDRNLVKTLKVSSARDQRWQHCDIKSTALLGNVMHFQQGYAAGNNETILYNERDELTEGSACNVYVIKDGVVNTPPLDHQILPGITRLILLDILRKDGSIPVQERVIPMSEVLAADEIWLTSSSKEIAPVIMIDGKPVGSGEPGPVWEAAQKLYSANKFNY